MTRVVTPCATVQFAYSIGDVVYHRMASERRRGLVTGLGVNPGGKIYFVTWQDGQEFKHYELELTTEYFPDFDGGD